MHVCQRCGKENQEHYKFCLGCGGEIGDAPSVDTPLPSRSGKSAKNLPRLDEDDGNASTSADALAADDGTDPSREAAPPRSAVPSPMGPSVTAPGGGGARPCPTCGNAIPAGFVFCGQCGARIEAGSKGAPASGPVASGSSRGKLVLIRPDGTEGGTHPLNAGVNVIGRGTGALFDADSYLSPRHAELVLSSGSMLVRDADSLNGIFFKLSDEEEILDGEVFRIGQELLRFDVIHAPAPLEDGTEVMGSPNPGYWGRVALVVGRDQDGSAFPLFGDAVILGRERGDILFPEDGYVSGTHARLSYREGHYYLADMNSSNGSFLRIRGERTVRSGTFVLMGQQLFRIQF